jgi:hypothetical protein
MIAVLATIVAEPGDRRQVPAAQRFGAALPPFARPPRLR